MRGFLCVCIPMFNEAPSAERCVVAVTRVLERLEPGIDLLVVDDGSRDGTPAILRACEGRSPRFSHVAHPVNLGYGKALETGAREARARGYENVLAMDSDLTNDPELIPQFVALLRQGFDLVKASRFVPGGGMSGVPEERARVSRLGNRIASALFRMGIRDCTNGFRAVRLEKLDGFVSTERGFASILEELLYLKRRGVRAAELPYTLTARAKEQGETKFRYRPRVFWAYLKHALRAALVRAPRAQ